MLTLILSLVDRCIQLVKERRQQGRDIITNYLDPILKDFEAVHQGYLETFRAYRRMILESPSELTEHHEVFNRLREDITFTSGERTKLWELTSINMPDELEPFLRAIYYYLFDGSIMLQNQLQKDVPGGALPSYSNVYRIVMTNTLLTVSTQPLPAEQKRATAVKALDEMVEHMQRKYADVYHTANELKFSLIN